MASAKELQAQLDEQQEVIDQVTESLEASYTVESTRADFVEAVGDALDILSGEEESEEETSEEED